VTIMIKTDAIYVCY